MVVDEEGNVVEILLHVAVHYCPAAYECESVDHAKATADRLVDMEMGAPVAISVAGEVVLIMPMFENEWRPPVLTDTYDRAVIREWVRFGGEAGEAP